MRAYASICGHIRTARFFSSPNAVLLSCALMIQECPPRPGGISRLITTKGDQRRPATPPVVIISRRGLSAILSADSSRHSAFDDGGSLGEGGSLRAWDLVLLSIVCGCRLISRKSAHVRINPHRTALFAYYVRISAIFPRFVARNMCTCFGPSQDKAILSRIHDMTIAMQPGRSLCHRAMPGSHPTAPQ
jgi:hypothetical protein